MATTIIFIVVIIAVGVGYSAWLRNGVKPRVFTTRLSADQVRAIFTEKVARAGWSIVDDGNPLVAQSPLLTGTRQQIGLTTKAEGGLVRVDARPLRLVVKLITRTPTKGHTIRIRLNSFVAAVREQDPALQLVA